MRFGRFTLDASRRELRHGGVLMPIGSRAFDLLEVLIERRGQLATKRELMSRVWPGTVVEENNLAAQVVALRRILSADPELSGCLQTVSGRGYRFVAQVYEPPVDAARPPSPRADGEALSLVVLPFTSFDGDTKQHSFAQGLSHTISTDLSRISGLTVIAPATAAACARLGADTRQISQELSVQFVLSGSLQHSNSDVRINAHLIRGDTGVQVWSELFDGHVGELLAFQDRITGRIANSIGREIFVAAARGGMARDIDARAFDFLLRGIAADNRPQSLAVLQQQEALFARAVELDPHHAEAHARLARAVLLQITQVHSATPHDEVMILRGTKAAETAVALGPYNARAHAAMGLVHVLRGHFERAVVSNEAAIGLDRNYAIAHNNLGNSLAHLGDGPDALRAAEAALRLDPRGPAAGSFWTTRGYAQLIMQSYEEALGSFRRAQSANPMLPRAHVGAAISSALVGDLGVARAAVSELLTIAPNYRLSETMDGSRATSTAAYSAFFEGVLRRGAEAAGLPV